MTRLYWWFRVVFLSMRWIPRFNLGDRVIWRGKEWVLIQGVCDPTWDLIRGNKSPRDGYERCENVHKSEFRKVRTPRNYWGSFQSGYQFYMGYWYDIWVREGVKPWMLGCNIWARNRSNGT
jgi:hypothetical protein